MWSEDVRTLTISSEGGGLAVRPPNSECAPGAAEYTFTVATLQLDSIRCEGASSNAPLLNVERSRTLTAAELEALRTSLEALKVVESDECGADKPAIDLTVVDSSGTSKYRDSFYACVQDPRPMIASAALEQLFSKLGGLATSGVETK